LAGAVLKIYKNNHGGNSYGTVFNARDEFGELRGSKIPVDFAMNARSFGCKAYTCTSEEELRDALKDSEQYTDVPVLFDIKVVPGSMSDGFESWWRVGVAEVSNEPRVNEAYADLVENIAKTRDY